jgi:hypothetical protein
MSFLSDLFSGGAGSIVDSVGKVLDSVVTTKEEKMQLENELRKSEIQFQLDLKKLSNEEQKMFLDDVGNARQRDVQVQTSEYSTKLGKNIASFLALGTTVLTLGLFFILIFSPQVIEPNKKDVILYVLGVLSAILTQIYSFYFGSSAGSAAKSQTIANMKDK